MCSTGFLAYSEAESHATKALTLGIRALEHILQDFESTLVPLAGDHSTIDPLVCHQRRRHRGLVPGCRRRIEDSDPFTLALLFEETFFGVGENGSEQDPCGHARGFVLGEETTVLVGRDGRERDGRGEGEQRFDVRIESKHLGLRLTVRPPQKRAQRSVSRFTDITAPVTSGA